MLTKETLKKEIEEALYSTAGKSFAESDLTDKYYALGNVVRKHTGKIWSETGKNQRASKAKTVYYFSMEYLTGKFMEKNLEYLGIYEVVKDFFEDHDICLGDLFDIEAEPGLGNGGLGRLAVAFLDSLSSMSMPGHGYGLRYEKGLFKQSIENGYQKEEPQNWLKEQNIWEFKRPSEAVEVRYGGGIQVIPIGKKFTFRHVDYSIVKAVPYDTPFIGYKNHNVNTLRLWSAESTEDLNLKEFSKGNLCGAFNKIDEVKSICQVLYPDDSYYDGKRLRLKQEYFLVSAGVQDVVRKSVNNGIPLEELHKYTAIHINDTHPAMAVPELMRILMDEYYMEWEQAWKITVKTCAFTNHTLLEEAMEKWDISLYRDLLPRIWQITEEINNRFLAELRNVHRITSAEAMDKLSIIHQNTVRMVNLSIVGSHSINGVAKLHSDLLKERELRHFYNIYPQKFNNKTNGIIHRHWLLSANKNLADLTEDLIGPGFKTNPIQMRELLKHSNDKQVLDRIMEIKHENKKNLSKYIYDTTGIKTNPHGIFDIQAKRIHEYKRQLMNILHVMYLYDKLKTNPNMDMVPRTFIFAGKAAPGYYIAKEIIKLINTVARVVNSDLTIKDKLKIVFLEDYSVSLATKMIPAADVSEQISTATKEASGTSNMKYMMNGAITLATLDGANIEIMKEVGENNIVVFGLKDYEVYDFYQRGNYDPQSLYFGNPVIKETIDKLVNGYFRVPYGEFQPIYDSLVKYGDRYFILKDFESYMQAQRKIGNMYRNKYQWAEMSLSNTACSGAFSSDYTIGRYANEIWGVKTLTPRKD
ncbi:glycogen/starch/alpha-glucan phosphorylase [Alkalibacter saccharofermentans]|uniref:Alpha-1,4 glucan phosphorylase n=1 Tax=Alkalibacter saccharofermentans DSM 14828 TaxID=1120975 RepID=A0A1M4S9P9_9FIRM|nr:glycogen/starch/alpha-glucan phosphorylase [Alkalibacter saccharofermentans]SHE28919.1 starch phosphorylase [Alkalibacter saccharofermentans DSM 14828]